MTDSLTLASYYVYALGAALAAPSVAIYLHRHWYEIKPRARIMTIFVAFNYFNDGVSKLWFAVWRELGRPVWMPGHWIVDLVTFNAALSVFVAFWFWGRATRLGDRGTVLTSLVAIMLALGLAGVRPF